MKNLNLWILLIGFLFVNLLFFDQHFLVESSRIRVRHSRRQWCRGSRRLEHLRGRCMFHYECVQQSGVSIGHCLTNLIVGSCCMVPHQYYQQNQLIKKPFGFNKKLEQNEPSFQRLMINYNPNINEIQSKQNGINVYSTQGDLLSMKMDDSTTLRAIIPPQTVSSSTTTTSTMTTIETDSQMKSSTKQIETVVTTINDDENNNIIGIDCDAAIVDGQTDVDDQNSIKFMLPTPTTRAIPTTVNKERDEQDSCPPTIDDEDSNSIMNYWPSSPSPLQTSDTTKIQNELVLVPDESISSPIMVNSPSPKPIQVNQNEFYEIVNTNNQNKKPTSTTTIITDNTSNSSLSSSHFNTVTVPSTVSSTTTISTTTSRSNKFRSRMCGVRPLRPTGRVVGGRNAQFGEWPWQVLIKEKSWLGFFSKSKCGGVLIDYKWILTAAHCQPGMMGSLIVMLGQHELHGTQRQLRPVVKTVRRMIVHRDFDPDTFDNDIALLELDTPFEMQPHIVPICLPTQDDDYVGEYAYVAGWGKLSYGGVIPSILQTVRLPIIENPLCQKMFTDAGHYKYIRNRFLCAGYPQGGRDTCEGDSGGPLMMKQDNVWTLIGTVSHGIKCAEPNLPGVYMKTWSYLPWIRGIIERNK